jgi:hypothetical protein
MPANWKNPRTARPQAHRIATEFDLFAKGEALFGSTLFPPGFPAAENFTP